MLQRYVRKKLGITSPSETDMSAGRAFIDGFQHAMAQPYTPPPPLTDEERAELEAKYPPYEITAENVDRVIGIVIRYGYKVTIGFDDEYHVLIEDAAWTKKYLRESSGRYGDGDSPDLEEALGYAFASFCHDHDGAMLREIAALA